VARGKAAGASRRRARPGAPPSSPKKNKAIEARKVCLARPREVSSAAGGPESPVELARTPLAKPTTGGAHRVLRLGSRTSSRRSKTAETTTIKPTASLR